MLRDMMNPKYKGHAIEIDLSKWGYRNYIAECVYHFDRRERKYALSIWLRRNDVEDRMRASSKKLDTQYISGTEETIVEYICRIVHQACLCGYFDRYVERYEYELECFERGNELYEQARTNRSDNDSDCSVR